MGYLAACKRSCDPEGCRANRNRHRRQGHDLNPNGSPHDSIEQPQPQRVESRKLAHAGHLKVVPPVEGRGLAEPRLRVYRYGISPGDLCPNMSGVDKVPSMNIGDYCTVPEAAKLGDLSVPYVRYLLAHEKIRGVKMGTQWLVLKKDVLSFERKPGVGRPKKSRPRRKK